MISLLSRKPKFIVFFITSRCNSNCIMCNVWRKQSDNKELPLADIDKFFSDNLLSRSLERINLTGGEPTLYPHLLETIRIFLKRCLRLKCIDMPTNGLDAAVILEKVESILALLFHVGINLFVTVSLDGIEEIAEKVRNVPQAFEKADKTLKGLIELKDLYKSKLVVNLNATISRINYSNLEQLRGYALENKVGINFTPAAISEIGVESVHRKNEFLMGQDEKKQVALFFEKLIKNSEITKTYGDFVINWLKGKKRRAGCVFRQREAILLEPTGDLYLCGNFKELWIGNMQRDEFKKIWKNINFLNPAGIRKKCEQCVSNCYMR